jgi:hypothetical protein
VLYSALPQMAQRVMSAKVSSRVTVIIIIIKVTVISDFCAVRSLCHVLDCCTTTSLPTGTIWYASDSCMCMPVICQNPRLAG